MATTTTTDTLTNSKRTKPHGGRAPKMTRWKSVVVVKVPMTVTIAPSMMPNVPMMTKAMTLMPVMMAAPSTESA